MKLKVTVNGVAYDVAVDVEEEPAPTLGGLLAPAPAAVAAPAHAASTAPAHVRAPADELKVLRAPISGMVTKVLVEQGEEVELGATLLVLEAMKMETEITAPVAGTIATVTVARGDSVTGGQVLVEWA